MKKALTLTVFTTLIALAATAEARADLVLHANSVAPGWLPVRSLPLTPALAAVGLPETGTGYFSVGAPTVNPAFLNRFNPTAPTYLNFFGGYVLDNFPFAADWENPDGSQKTNMTVSDAMRSANELVSIGNADQFAWLAAFPPAPFVSTLVPGSLVVVPAKPLFPSLDGWFLLSFEISTVSELGADPANVSAQTGLNVVYPSFSQFSGLVPPFEPYIAEALVLIKYDVAHQNFLAVYGNGANWKTLDGRDHNTSVATIAQILSMMSQVTFS